MADSCISCATVSGSLATPGGVVFEDLKWMVVLRGRPVRFPCLPLIILKRHCEHVADLDPEESTSLGTVMTLTAQALTQILQPAKVHFGLYAEAVTHIHVHVFPRMPDMPAGNIANLLLGQWMSLLQAVGLKQAYPDEVVSGYAEKLRRAYSLPGSSRPHPMQG